ncbi:MAG: hypothetical protein IJ777_00640 [Clostridia bacterium]|nr:hypothetical protein [Clostridia bacterium]
MANLQTFIRVQYETVPYAQEALKKVRRNFLNNVPASKDKSRVEEATLYVPRGVFCLTDQELETFLRECDGALPRH